MTTSDESQRKVGRLSSFLGQRGAVSLIDLGHQLDALVGCIEPLWQCGLQRSEVDAMRSSQELAQAHLVGSFVQRPRNLRSRARL